MYDSFIFLKKFLQESVNILFGILKNEDVEINMVQFYLFNYNDFFFLSSILNYNSSCCFSTLSSSAMSG